MSEWKIDAATWLRDYEANGYVVVENAVEPHALQEMRDELDRIEKSFMAGELPASLARNITTDDDRSRAAGIGGGGRQISNIMELAVFAPVFRDLILNPRILDILEVLFGSPEFSFHNYKAICKMPHNDTPFQWHRDLPYLQHTTANLITCMICVDDMTAENGGTVVCPGSHHVPEGYVDPGNTSIAEPDVPHPRVTVECPAGSVVLFHVNIVHGGGPNMSSAKRRNAISIWAGPNCLPATGARYVYEFVKPRSPDAMARKQIELTFGYA